MSVQEDSLANVVTTLEAATIGGVAMTTATVHRSRPPFDEPFFKRLDDSVGDVNVFVEQGNTNYIVETHNTQSGPPLVVGTLEVFIQVARRWRTDDDPNKRTINPDTEMNGAIDDVIAALLSTRYRGNFARDTTITDDGAIDAEGILELLQWLAHELRFQITFEFPEDTP